MSYKQLIAKELEGTITTFRDLEEKLKLFKLPVDTSSVLETKDSSSLGKDIETPILIASDKQMLLLKDKGNYCTSEILYHFVGEKCTGLAFSEFDNTMYSLASFERYVKIQNVNILDEFKLVRFLSSEDFNHKRRINSLNVFYNGKNNLSSKIVIGCEGKGVGVVSLDDLASTNVITLTDKHLLYSSNSHPNLPLRTVVSKEHIYVSEGNTIFVFDGNTLNLGTQYQCSEQITALAVNSEGKLYYGTMSGELYVEGESCGSFRSNSPVKKIKFMHEKNRESMLLMVHDDNKHLVWKKNGSDYDLISPNGWKGNHIDFAIGKKLYTLDEHSLYEGNIDNNTTIFRSEDRLNYIEILEGI